MTTIKINKELDIKRNQNYKNMIQDINKVDFESLISMVFQAGATWERNYNIRKDKECYNNKYEYISNVSKHYNKNQEEFISCIIDIMQQNIAMKKALKQNNIDIIIEDI